MRYRENATKGSILPNQVSTQNFNVITKMEPLTFWSSLMIKWCPWLPGIKFPITWFSDLGLEGNVKVKKFKKQKNCGKFAETHGKLERKKILNFALFGLYNSYNSHATQDNPYQAENICRGTTQSGENCKRSSWFYSKLSFEWSGKSYIKSDDALMLSFFLSFS